MDQRLNFVTLAVADTARSRAFYADGLGWEVAHNPGPIGQQLMRAAGLLD